jgi:multidrug transporter EmrE-like cation transporter
MRQQRRTNFIWGLVVLGIAAYVLAQALGLVPAGIADAVGRGWPALLVFTGLMLLLRGRMPLGGLISLVLSLALVGGIAFTAFNSRAGEVRTDNVVPLSQAIAADITLLRVRADLLTTDIDVQPSASRELGVTGQFTGSLESVIDISYETGADSAATLVITEVRPPDLPRLDQVGRGTFQLTLPPGIPLDIDIGSADGEVTLSLNGLMTERVNAESGRGDLVVALPDYQPTLVSSGDQMGALTARDGALTLFVPEALAARLELNRGGSGIEPQYDAGVFNYLVGDVLEARTAATASFVARLSLTAPRGPIRVDSTP